MIRSNVMDRSEAIAPLLRWRRVPALALLGLLLVVFAAVFTLFFSRFSVSSESAQIEIVHVFVAVLAVTGILLAAADLRKPRSGMLVMTSDGVELAGLTTLRWGSPLPAFVRVEDERFPAIAFAMGRLRSREPEAARATIALAVAGTYATEDDPSALSFAVRRRDGEDTVFATVEDTLGALRRDPAGDWFVTGYGLRIPRTDVLYAKTPDGPRVVDLGIAEVDPFAQQATRMSVEHCGVDPEQRDAFRSDKQAEVGVWEASDEVRRQTLARLVEHLPEVVAFAGWVRSEPRETDVEDLLWEWAFLLRHRCLAGPNRALLERSERALEHMNPSVRSLLARITVAADDSGVLFEPDMLGGLLDESR